MPATTYQWPAVVNRSHCDEVISRGGLVTAPDPLVAEAGAAILRIGGNAVDAIVAAALADGVVEPPMSGLGGGLTMTLALRDPDRAVVVEGHMVSPAAATTAHFPIAKDQPDPNLAPGGWSVTFFDQPMVQGLVNVLGAKAVAVPGAVAALLAAHERFGRLRRDQVFEPAIALAANGFRVNWFIAACAASDMRNLTRDQGCRETFLPHGAPLRGPLDRPGARFVQPALARTLEILAAGGADAFYRGEIGESLVATVQDLGGLLTMADLDHYRPSIVTPLAASYGPLTLLGAPTAGLPTVAAALYLYELGAGGDTDADAGASPDDAVAWARAIKLAFEDRERYMTLDAGRRVPWAALASSAYARARHHADIAGAPPPDPSSVFGEPKGPMMPTGAPGEGGHTSQMAAVDSDGNMASLTATILADFGARVLDPATGILLNNGIAYFDPRPQMANGIRPGVHVLSAMAPIVIADRDRGPLVAVGASGGRRIISGVAQIVAALGRGSSLQDAVEQPRIHAESTRVLLDTLWPEAAAAELSAAGFEVVPVIEEPTTVHFARPNGVAITPDGTRRSGLDPRKPAGAAVG